MLSVHKYVYQRTDCQINILNRTHQMVWMKGFELHQIDFKYNEKKFLGKFIDMESNNDYIITADFWNVYVFGREHFIVHISDDFASTHYHLSGIPLSNVLLLIPILNVELFNDILIFNGGNNFLVFNIRTKKWTEMSKLDFYIYIHGPLISRVNQNEGRIYYFHSVENYLQNKPNFFEEYLDDDDIVDIFVSIGDDLVANIHITYNDCRFIVRNVCNGKVKYILELNKYKFEANNGQVIGVGNKVFILYDSYTGYTYLDTVIVVDGYMIFELKNTSRITMYNSYYDVFLNSKLQMFKIINNEFVPFRFQYDLWYDVDKPQYVEYVIDALNECNLFPNEIYNIVYHQLITTKN